MKFQRTWKMVVTTSEEVETFGYPFTIDFNIDRNTFASANTATFNIYNLGLSTRTKVFQDKYRIDDIKFVDFYAGYDGKLSLAFKGKILECYSERDGGSTNVITIMQAQDVDIGQSYSSHTFEEGTPKIDVLKTLISDMPNTTVGAIGTMEGKLSTPLIINEQSFVAINKLTGGQSFVDLGNLNTLQLNEVLEDVVIPKITSASGLLGSPKRRDAQLDVDVLFSPEIVVGQLIEVESTVQKNFDGQFKVVGLHHTGTISAAVCGEARTTLSLFIGSLLPNSSQVFTGVTQKQPLSYVKGQKVKPVTNEILSSIKQVRDYIIRNKAVPKVKITNNIWWTEMIQNYSRQGQVPSMEVMTNLYNAATALQEFIDKFYKGNKVTITSGWRSKTYNATIRGASPTSNHIKGSCIDFLIAGVPVYSVLFRDFKKFWRGFAYNGGSFIHCDTMLVGGHKGDL